MSEVSVRDGDTIKVHYAGKLADGSVFDSSEGKEPLEFIVGADEIIRGFDQGVVGMKVGERKTIVITPGDAYGDRREDLVIKVARQDLPAQIDPVEGTMLRMRTVSGRYIPVKITAVTAQDVTIDANHPLAGQELTFEVELVEIV